MNIEKLKDESDFAIDIYITLKDTSSNEVATFGSEYLLDKTIQYIMRDVANSLSMDLIRKLNKGVQS
tara:strand:+ start:39 stop:239 length:201 start_codon:yes stop_codon:yes gene_type:complete